MSAPQTAIEPGLNTPGLNAPGLTASKAFERALEIAAEHAGDVDRRGRFPSEAIEALRTAGALGWGVPIAYGGAGAGLDTLSDATFELSRRCAATGMVFAMHQIQ